MFKYKYPKMEYEKKIDDILNSEKIGNEIVPLSTDLGLDMLVNENKIKKDNNDKTNTEKDDDDDDVVSRNHADILDESSVSSNNDDYEEDENEPLKMNHFNVKKPEPDKEINTREERIRKIELLRIFTEYQKQGHSLSSNFNIHSNLVEMELEYEIIKSHKIKKNALKLSQGFLINAVQALEFMNTSYDPVGLDLIGFSEVVSLGIDDYDDVLEEIYEKYKHYGRKVEPELKLVLMLSASATTFHASKKMLKGVPGMEDQLKKNPSFINKLGKKLVEEKKEDESVEDELSKLELDKIKKNREFMSRLNKQRKQKSYTDTESDVGSVSMKRPSDIKLTI